MTEEEWDAVVAVHLKGHFVPTRWAAAYWRERVKAGETVHGERDQHVVDIGSAVEPRPDELRRGEVGHRDVHADRGEGAVALRREGELHRAGGAHSPHRSDSRSRRHHQGARRPRLVRHLGSGEHLAARRLPRHRGLPVHRRDVLRAGRPGEEVPVVEDGRRRRAATSAGRSPACSPSSASSPLPPSNPRLVAMPGRG